MFLRKLLKKIRAHKDYEPLIEVRIHKQAILDNLSLFARRMPKGEITPVLKSNAYGHGLVEVATILEKTSVPFLCVDSYFEAHHLRHEDISKPLLILGYTEDKTVLSSKLKQIHFAVHSLDQLYALRDTKKDILIHLKIDTGMHRYGILPDELTTALTYIKKHEYIKLMGVFSHLGDADGETDIPTKEQIRIWNGLVQKVRNTIKDVPYFHLAQTAGSYFASHIDANVMRLGIGLYGVTTKQDDSIKDQLYPALSIHTKLTSIKRLKSGDHVGYNNTFTATENMTIATIPIGYSEGLHRNLSNKGFVYVKDKPCPIIGRISMNIASIDISHVHDVHRGDPVEILSTDTNRKNSLQYMSESLQAFPYELLVYIPRHLKRVIV